MIFPPSDLYAEIVGIIIDKPLKWSVYPFVFTVKYPGTYSFNVVYADIRGSVDILDTQRHDDTQIILNLSMMQDGIVENVKLGLTKYPFKSSSETGESVGYILGTFRPSNTFKMNKPIYSEIVVEQYVASNEFFGKKFKFYIDMTTINFKAT